MNVEWRVKLPSTKPFIIRSPNQRDQLIYGQPLTILSNSSLNGIDIDVFINAEFIELSLEVWNTKGFLWVWASLNSSKPPPYEYNLTDMIDAYGYLRAFDVSLSESIYADWINSLSRAIKDSNILPRHQRLMQLAAHELPPSLVVIPRIGDAQILLTDFDVAYHHILRSDEAPPSLRGILTAAPTK